MSFFQTLLFLSIPFILRGQLTYCQWQAANCQAVEEFVLEHHDEIQRQAQLAKVSAPFFLAVVAPEIANYNLLKDQVEYRMLEVFYVEKGKDYANYSVGPFQMKPIFVEQLEQELNQRSELKDLSAAFQYHSTDLFEIRKMRVRRLKTVYWQLRYLMLYHQIIRLRFPDLQEKSTEEQLQFLAAAYNRGYTHSKETILKWMQTAWFPNYGEPPSFIYSELAVDFWKKIRGYW
jgi:hypothetical protein